MLVCEGVARPVVEFGVPEGFGGDTQALTLQLAVDNLDAKFVARDFKL